MINLIKKYGFLEFIYIYASVRIFGVSLDTFSNLCRDLKLKFPMDLARDFFRDRHSYEEIKMATLKSDPNYNEKDRKKFEDELISSINEES